jgi:GT2 family glycosyltransferase
LAVQNRPAEYLERTLETYVYQSLRPADRVLVDYGSEPSQAAAYRELCARFSWRFVVAIPATPGWSLSAAYNIAVSTLSDLVDIVFKSDIDVLLGRDVLQTAATMAREKLCIFSCLAAAEGTCYPSHFGEHEDLVRLFQAPIPPAAMLGEGVHAYPRKWFQEVGGFDLEFRSWGFEDSDLRARAQRSIGTTHAAAPILIHQWHPPAIVEADARKNRARYDQMKHDGPIARNGGRVGLIPKEAKVIIDGKGVEDHVPEKSPEKSPETKKASSSLRKGKRRKPMRIAFAWRSMNVELCRQSSELLGLDRLADRHGLDAKLFRVTGTDSLSYFSELAALDTDWVVSLDDDVFVLDPDRLNGLVRFMEQHEFAACGMPDGGVVQIRRHNPVACNAFFNIFDLRRTRRSWENWETVNAARHKSDYERLAPVFARRTPIAYDDFEPYYGVFYTLLDFGAKILYLDAEEWHDGVTTLLKDAAGQPLLLHGWYSRIWRIDPQTSERYRIALDYAWQQQSRMC